MRRESRGVGNRTINDILTAAARTGRAPPGDCRKRCCKVACPATGRDRFLYSPGAPCPADFRSLGNLLVPETGCTNQCHDRLTRRVWRIRGEVKPLAHLRSWFHMAAVCKTVGFAYPGPELRPSDQHEYPLRRRGRCGRRFLTVRMCPAERTVYGWPRRIGGESIRSRLHCVAEGFLARLQSILSRLWITGVQARQHGVRGRVVRILWPAYLISPLTTRRRVAACLRGPLRRDRESGPGAG